jgi:hypothetical protein
MSAIKDDFDHECDKYAHIKEEEEDSNINQITQMTDMVKEDTTKKEPHPLEKQLHKSPIQ